MHEELFVSEFLFTQFSLTIVLQELLQCHLNVLFSIISPSKTNNQALHYFYLFIYLPRISYMLSSEIYSIYTCSMMVYTSQMSHVDSVQLYFLPPPPPHAVNIPAYHPNVCHKSIRISNGNGSHFVHTVQFLLKAYTSLTPSPPLRIQISHKRLNRL